MAVKFSACYPELPSGSKTPCGIIADRQSGFVQEIICPELSVAVCSELVALWNRKTAESFDGTNIEDQLARFITNELKQK